MVSGWLGVDPHVWCLAMPLGVLLYWFVSLPMGHRWRRWWDEIQEVDTMLLERMGVGQEDVRYKRYMQLQQHCLMAGIGGLLAVSVLSLGAFVGYL